MESTNKSKSMPDKVDEVSQNMRHFIYHVAYKFSIVENGKLMFNFEEIARCIETSSGKFYSKEQLEHILKHFNRDFYISPERMITQEFIKEYFAPKYYQLDIPLLPLAKARESVSQIENSTSENEESQQANKTRTKDPPRQHSLRQFKSKPKQPTKSRKHRKVKPHK